MENFLEQLQSDPTAVISKLEEQFECDKDNLEVSQLLAEAYFEIGDLESALKFTQHSLKLDPTGSRGGFDKFMWQAQIVGGHEGHGWYQSGINGLKSQALTVSPLGLAAPECANLRQKVCAGLNGMIEIWLTELCMEPNAEQMCERLVTEALMVDDTNPEVWSMLGSIRISQCRQSEAKDALEKSWSLWSNCDVDGSQIPSLIRLAQSLIEVGCSETAIDITTSLATLDDQVPDIYYLNALAYQQLLERSQTDSDRISHISAAREALELMLELPELDDSLAEAGNDILSQLPPPQSA